jgi:phosphonopyruvate decarboxylase
VIAPAAFHAALKRSGLTFFAGVPDSLLKDLCAFIADQVPAEDHVITANEGAAVALAAGYHLATGQPAVVYLQNSGTGNAINPLLSLADPAVYAIPMLLLIGWRGEPGATDEPQHVTQGRIQERLLEAIEVTYEVIGPDTEDVEGTIAAHVDAMRADPRPHALLIRKGTFAPYQLVGPALAPRPLSRTAAIEAVAAHAPPDAVVVSTTGFTSRELFDARERRGQPHSRDFLTVGSMGHASQIALGIAQRHGTRTVICLDGDGAVLMHMGNLAIIATRAPANMHHVVLNNGAHDSVGGQPTAAASVDLAGVARACGYRTSAVASTADELAALLDDHLSQPGPTFLEVRVQSDPTTTAGRPTSSPTDNKTALMRELGAS